LEIKIVLAAFDSFYIITSEQFQNFNGFRVLAALLHGTPAVGVSQTLRR